MERNFLLLHRLHAHEIDEQITHAKKVTDLCNGYNTNNNHTHKVYRIVYLQRNKSLGVVFVVIVVDDVVRAFDAVHGCGPFSLQC